jgi:hypothetical protein
LRVIRPTWSINIQCNENYASSCIKHLS